MFKFTDKLDFRRDENRIALSNLSIYHTWKNIKSSYNNNRFRISWNNLSFHVEQASTWNDKFELPDGSYYLYQIFRVILNTF